MPQYALRTGRFPVNNRCHNFPLRTPPRLVASLCGPKFPYAAEIFVDERRTIAVTSCSRPPLAVMWPVILGVSQF
jgi:hypothetical protein